MMIINVLNNGKILQEQLNIYLPDLTILTGENGSGKTQLLETFRDNAHGYWERHEQDIHNSGGENSKMIYPIRADDETELKDIIFSYPGLKRNEYEYQQEKPLIQQIKEQWNILFPIAKSYIFIKDKAFSDEKSELDALNRAIIDFVKNLTSDTKQFSDRSLKKAGQHQLTQLKTLATQANKTIDELTFIDFLMFYPVPTQVFSSALNLLFHQFYLKKKYYPNLTQDVSPPWDVFNDLLDKASFKYISKYTPANNEESIPAVSLLDKSNNKDVYIENPKLPKRVFDRARSIRLHWVRYHLEEKKTHNMLCFNVKEPEGFRTYVYDQDEEYVIVLEPLRDRTAYYLLSAYKLEGKDSQRKKIERKYKRRTIEPL